LRFKGGFQAGADVFFHVSSLFFTPGGLPLFLTVGSSSGSGKPDGLEFNVLPVLCSKGDVESSSNYGGLTLSTIGVDIDD
jgi:hypothetical protein